MQIDHQVLRRLPLFGDFSDSQLNEIAELVTVRTYVKHEFVFREGDFGHAFFIILAGSVGVVRLTGGRETILSILKEGDFFGEMSLLDTSTRSAGVRAMTDVTLGVIEREPFLAVIERNSAIGRALVIALADRLRAANELITSTASQDIRSRIASLLLNLTRLFGEPTEHGTKITLRLTNQEMANMIGTTRETVNRTLNRLWDERVIDMRTSHIVIIDHDALRTLVVRSVK